MSKLTIKTRPVGEANEPDINKAYQEFSDALGGYNDNTANFMKDCVYIAHSRGENGVKGLRKQGYSLNFAAQLPSDTLHTCYVKDEGGVHKAIDLYFNPHERKIEVVTVGFDPQYPHAESTKIFSVQKGADAFADFIEGLSDYKGESKMKESKLKIKVHESKKNEKSYLLDADDRNILNRYFYSDSDMDLLERNFGMLKFVDSFVPDDKTNGTATQTEISAEDAETMVGDHESFLVLCMDTLANKDGFDYQVYRVYGPEGTDYITCSYK